MKIYDIPIGIKLGTYQIENRYVGNSDLLRRCIKTNKKEVGKSKRNLLSFGKIAYKRNTRLANL